MKFIRTPREFTKENMPENFLRETLSIAGCHKLPTWEDQYSIDDFTIVPKFHGTNGPSTALPWKEDLIKSGYTKELSCVYIYLKNFDSVAIIYNSGRLKGQYVKEDVDGVFTIIRDHDCTIDPLRWVALLLEYDFITYDYLDTVH